MRLRLEKYDRRISWRIVPGFGRSTSPRPGVTSIPAWAVGIVLAWLGLAAVAQWIAPRMNFALPMCLFKRITGLPCPTCGTTRGMMHLLHGDVVGAWLYNPLVFTVLSIAAAVILVRILWRVEVRVELSRPERVGFWCVLAVAVLANWAYVIHFIG
jgi:hypothetical protein